MSPSTSPSSCRCMFCGQEGFSNLDASWLHVISFKNTGFPLCPKITIYLDASNYWRTDGYGVLR